MRTLALGKTLYVCSITSLARRSISFFELQPAKSKMSASTVVTGLIAMRIIACSSGFPTRNSRERRSLLRREVFAFTARATSARANFYWFPINGYHRGMRFHFVRARFPLVIDATDEQDHRPELHNRR